MSEAPAPSRAKRKRSADASATVSTDASPSKRGLMLKKARGSHGLGAANTARGGARGHGARRGRGVGRGSTSRGRGSRGRGGGRGRGRGGHRRGGGGGARTCRATRVEQSTAQSMMETVFVTNLSEGRLNFVNRKRSPVEAALARAGLVSSERELVRIFREVTRSASGNRMGQRDRQRVMEGLRKRLDAHMRSTGDLVESCEKKPRKKRSTSDGGGGASDDEDDNDDDDDDVDDADADDDDDEDDSSSGEGGVSMLRKPGKPPTIDPDAHPSWIAKQKEKAALAQFQGKRIKF